MTIRKFDNLFLPNYSVALVTKASRPCWRASFSAVTGEAKSARNMRSSSGSGKRPASAGEAGTQPGGRGAKLNDIGEGQERNVFRSSIRRNWATSLADFA